ncbi:MAG: AI-2E family transporter [Actinomycetota bacterium]|nr:AI-2E family transporter [Actinomycetota bacterium]
MRNSALTPATLYRAVLLAFGLAVAGLIFEQIATLILAVLIVVIIALPLSAFASLLQRIGIPRGIGASLGLLLGLGALGGLIALIVPIFNHEINQFASALPKIVDALRHRLGRLTGTSPNRTGQQIQHFVNTYTQHPTKLLGPLASVGASVVAGIATLIVVLLTALYTAINPEPLARGIVSLAPPAKRPGAEHILSRLRVAYLGWLRGLLIGMVVLGGVTYLGLRIVGLDFAAFFAVFTAVAMIIPYFGALLSSIPPIVYALTLSPGKALIVAIIYLVSHQVESNIIQPLVVARTVELHPAVVAVGVVAVDRLFGFAGLIIAVPILATARILVDELWIKPVEQHDAQGFTGEMTSSPMQVVSVAGRPAPRPPRPSNGD